MEKIFEVLEQNPEVAALLFLITLYGMLMSFVALVMYGENKKFRKFLNKNYPSENKY